MLSPHPPVTTVAATITSPTTLDDLPDDLTCEILAHLHVKDILRSRCVKRSWNKLTREIKFVNKHASIAANSLLLMLTQESFQFYMSNFLVSEEGIKELNEIKLNHEIYTAHSHFQLVGCLRGIVCLVDTDSSNVILWNTELRQVKVMAALNKGEDNSRSVFGFGNVLDALKFVCIFKNPNNKTLIKIGTVSSDSSWNSMKEFPLDIDDDLDLVGSGKHINGTVNWLMGTGPILSIELGEESVTKFLLPKCGDDWISKTLGVWKGCLGLLCRGVKDSDVWIMKNHANEESWIRILQIPNLNVLASPYIKNIVDISKDGKVLLEVMKDFNWKIIIFDSKNDKVIESSIEVKMGVKVWELYHESLIFP